MKKSEFVIVTAVSIILGTAMHFAHHLPFFGTAMGCVFPVCESVWEHMKMLFYPMLLTSVYLSVSRRDCREFGGMITASLVCIPLQIALFYAYWVFVRHSVLLVDIFAYLFVMIFGYCLGDRLTGNSWIRDHWKLFMAIAAGMIVLLAVLTYFYPHIHLFIPVEE